MQAPPAAKPWHFVLAALGLAAGVAALVILYFFDPATHGFYPRCAFHELTGLECPGCGTLRALHELLHGNFLAAWRLNCFVISLLPIGIWLGFRELFWMGTGKRLPGIVTRPIFGWALVVGLVLFGILRNV